MNILEKLLAQNPQVQKLMNSNIDPKSLVLSILKNNNIDIDRIINITEQFGIKIPQEIINDIKNVSTGTGGKRF